MLSNYRGNACSEPGTPAQGAHAKNPPQKNVVDKGPKKCIYCVVATIAGGSFPKKSNGEACAWG